MNQPQNQLLTKTKIFNIGSFNATKNNGTYNSNITINLPLVINRNDESIQNIYFSVLHAEIPNSFYLVNNTNNKLIINSITYTITNGNYNGNTLILALKNILPTTFNITYNVNTLKYTFTNTSNFTISKSSTLNRLIGGNTLADITSVSNTLTMPNVINLLPIPRINIRSPQLNFCNYNQGDGSGDIFLSIQNSAGLGSMNLYYNITDMRYLYENSSLQKLEIRITDDYNNELDLNGLDFYLTLQFDIEFFTPPRNDTFSKIVNTFS
jgi:hypothetical protein